MIIGIDQSKRSTACVSLTRNGDLYDFILINPPMYIDDEFLIEFVWNKIHKFLKSHNNIHAIALESAAFSATGSSNDILWGIQWMIRTSLLMYYPNTLRGILTAATWRSTILPLESQREFKRQYGGTIGLKHCAVAHLPDTVRVAFEDYLEENKETILLSKGLKADGSSMKYKDGIFDLADAYGIAKHRYLLYTGYKKPSKKKEKPRISKLQRRFPQAK